MGRISEPDSSALSNQLARLDTWILESELLAARTSDEETLRGIDADLARWRESRSVLRRTKQIDQFTSWTIATLSWSIFLFFVTMILPLKGNAFLLAFSIDLALFLCSSVAYIASIALRDNFVREDSFLQFSLRALILMMTVVAVVLALWLLAVRY